MKCARCETTIPSRHSYLSPCGTERVCSLCSRYLESLPGECDVSSDQHTHRLRELSEQVATLRKQNAELREMCAKVAHILEECTLF